MTTASAPDRHDDEVAVPRRELLERLEHALARRAELGAPQALLALAVGQVEPLDLFFCRRPRRLRDRVGHPHDGRGCRRGLERRIRVDAPRQSEQLLPPRRRVVVEQPLRAVEPAAGDTRERRYPIRRQAGRLRGEHRVHRLLRQAAERDELAAGADRLGQRAELVGQQNQHGVRRRLLEVLEQRVRSLVVQRVRGDEEVDAAIGLERPHVEVAAEPPDLVDANLVAERLEEVEVGVRAALHAAAIAEQVRRERERRLLLAHARRPVEEVRVHRAFLDRRRRGGSSPPAAR